MSNLTWPDVLGKLFESRSLSSDESAWAMERIMEGDATPAQFGAFIAALRTKGESVDEILGLVETMRRYSQRVDVPYEVVDTCGTGGDRAGTINVSTIAALVAAGAGARVAKHGNRAASSFCGSADVFEELGVKIDLGPEGVAKCIDEAGIGFCFAQVFHPSMKHAGPARKEIGVGTVFNILGPLTNPAGAKNQALGVANPTFGPKIVEVLQRLGAAHVISFHGSDGLDEITTSGPTTVWELKDGRVNEFELDAKDLGIERASSDAIKGGTPAENAKIAIDVLSGTESPSKDIVVVNAAAALVAAGIAADFPAGVERAKESIDSGKAQRALDLLIEVSNS